MLYFTKETISEECKHIAAAEELFVFNTIKQPFPSICGLYILIDKKIACGWTNCESTVVNILDPFAMQQILEF